MRKFSEGDQIFVPGGPICFPHAISVMSEKHVKKTSSVTEVSFQYCGGHEIGLLWSTFKLGKLVVQLSVAWNPSERSEQNFFHTVFDRLKIALIFANDLVGWQYIFGKSETLASAASKFFSSTVFGAHGKQAYWKFVLPWTRILRAVLKLACQANLNDTKISSLTVRVNILDNPAKLVIFRGLSMDNDPDGKRADLGVIQTGVARQPFFQALCPPIHT